MASNFIKRGHMKTKLPKDAATVYFILRTHIPQARIESYGFVLIDPQAGVINDGGYTRSIGKAYWRMLFDVVSRVPDGTTIMFHTRDKRLPCIMTAQEPLKYNQKDKEKFIKHCEKHRKMCYFHSTMIHPPKNVFEMQSRLEARKALREGFSDLAKR